MAKSEGNSAQGQDKGAMRLKSISHKAKPSKHTDAEQSEKLSYKTHTPIHSHTQTLTHTLKITIYFGHENSTVPKQKLLALTIHPYVYLCVYVDMFGLPVLINLKLTLFWDLKASFKLL